MPTIEPLSQGVRAYLEAFNLLAVCQSAGGRVYTSDNPKGATAAYWCRSADAGRVCEAAWQTGGDIMAVGHRCGVALTPHQIVLRRTADRTAALDQVIAAGIDDATLQTFNREYRSLRLRAKQRNESFMTYSEALRRLRAKAHIAELEAAWETKEPATGRTDTR